MDKFIPWLVSASANLLIGVVGIATSVVIGRSLGPSGRGVLAEAMLWPSLVLTLGGLVGTQSVVYFWAKGREDKTTAHVLGSNLLLAALLSVVLLPSARLVNHIALGSNGKPSYELANLYAWSIPVSLLSACLVPIWLAEQRFLPYWTARVAQAVLYLMAISIAAIIGRASAQVFIVATMMSMLVQVAVVAAIQLRVLRPRMTWNILRLRHIITFGTKVNLAGLPYHLNVRLDQILMSTLLTSTVLGYYVVAVAWASILGFVGNGVSAVALSRSASIAEFDDEGIANLLSSFRMISIVLIGLGIISAAVAPAGILFLYGRAFAPSILPAVVLCLASVLLNLNLTLHEIVRGRGHPGAGIWAELSGLCLTAVLLAVLLPVLGTLGAAIASLLAYAGVFVALLIMTRRYLGVSIHDCVILSRSDLATIRVIIGQIWPVVRSMGKRPVIAR